MSIDTNLSKTKKPYDFGTSVFLPFDSGPKSFSFVLKSALFYTIGILALTFLFEKILVSANITYQEQITRNPDLVFSALWTLLIKSLPYTLGMWVLWVMMETAFLRRVFFGGENSGFPWRFGKDELRVMLCQFVVTIIALVTLFLIALVVGAISMAIGYVLGSTVQGLFDFIGFFVVVLVTAAITIRFAPAAAQSVAEKRIALVDVWPVAYKRFWPAFGSYAMLWILGTIIYLALAIFVMLVLYGGDFVAEFQRILSQSKEGVSGADNMVTQSSGFNIKGLITTGLGNIYWAALGLCLAGVPAYLYKLYKSGQDNGEEPDVTS